jgi:hypothetical protein
MVSAHGVFLFQWNSSSSSFFAVFVCSWLSFFYRFYYCRISPEIGVEDRIPFVDAKMQNG